jgi:hypothetical protein
LLNQNNGQYNFVFQTQHPTKYIVMTFICDKENNIIRYPSFDEKLDKKKNSFR